MDGFTVETHSPPSKAHSVADAIGLVLNTEDLSEAYRSKLVCSLRAVARFCGLPVEMAMMDCAWLNTRMFEKPPAAFGMNPRRFSDVLSDLRFVLERLGHHAPRERGALGLSTAWLALWNQLKDRNDRARISGLLHYLSSRGIEPDAVEVGMMADYEKWFTTMTLNRDIAMHIRLTAYGWRDARALVANWPAVDLAAPKRRETYGIKLAAFPESFQHDVTAFTDNLRRGHAGKLFAEVTQEQAVIRRRRRKPAKPGTVDTRVMQILLAASALVNSGIPIAELRCLRDLVEPLDHAERIFSFFWQRGGEKANSHVAGIGEVLRQIAVHHCKPASPSAASIIEWAATVSPGRGHGMVEKVRKKLQAMIAPHVIGPLLNLPITLMQEAMQSQTSSIRVALAARQAVMLECLLVCPMRRNMLRLLRLDRHFARLGEGGRRITHFWVNDDIGKTDVPVEWPLPGETAEMLEIYITQFRPMLCGPDNSYLFPGEGAGPMSKGGLSTSISNTIAERIGVDVHPHLMRHFAAWLYLQHHPGAYDVVAKVLGHASSDTTRKFYVGLEGPAAARRYDAVVMQMRQETRPSQLAPIRLRRNRRMPKMEG